MYTGLGTWTQAACAGVKADNHDTNDASDYKDFILVCKLYYSFLLYFILYLLRTKLAYATVRATPLGAGFVDIFISQIHSESDDQIQYIIYQIDDNDLLDYSVWTN